jgi:hypothetical protein
LLRGVPEPCLICQKRQFWVVIRIGVSA